MNVIKSNHLLYSIKCYSLEAERLPGPSRDNQISVNRPVSENHVYYAEALPGASPLVLLGPFARTAVFDCIGGRPIIRSLDLKLDFWKDDTIYTATTFLCHGGCFDRV